jgi:predicted O-methyltransferase YrrM
MRYLEELDRKERAQGIPAPKRLRQVPPETGRFIAVLAASAPAGTYLEIGTSGGYSTLWLALACQENGRKVVTFELVPERAEIARETFRSAQVEENVELLVGDAREHLKAYNGVSFCFLDAAKEVYSDCYEKVVPKMVTGGILVADNVISHKEILEPFVQRVLNDERVDGLVVPIGSGLLVCRRTKAEL